MAMVGFGLMKVFFAVTNLIDHQVTVRGEAHVEPETPLRCFGHCNQGVHTVKNTRSLLITVEHSKRGAAEQNLHVHVHAVMKTPCFAFVHYGGESESCVKRPIFVCHNLLYTVFTGI